MVPWDKSLKTSAVPPNLAISRPLGDVLSHVFPWVTGEKPVGPLLGELSVQSALRGPFAGAPSAAIPPPAALLER